MTWKRINDERKKYGVFRKGDRPGEYQVGVGRGDFPDWTSQACDTLTEAYSSLLCLLAPYTDNYASVEEAYREGLRSLNEKD